VCVITKVDIFILIRV